MAKRKDKPSKGNQRKRPGQQSGTPGSPAVPNKGPKKKQG